MAKNSENSITKLSENIGRLVCEECGGKAEEMYSTEEGLICCNECIEGVLRKKRFVDEEAEWNQTQEKV